MKGAVDIPKEGLFGCGEIRLGVESLKSSGMGKRNVGEGVSCVMDLELIRGVIKAARTAGGVKGVGSPRRRGVFRMVVVLAGMELETSSLKLLNSSMVVMSDSRTSFREAFSIMAARNSV